MRPQRLCTVFLSNMRFSLYAYQAENALYTEDRPKVACANGSAMARANSRWLIRGINLPSDSDKLLNESLGKCHPRESLHGAVRTSEMGGRNVCRGPRRERTI